MSFQQPRTRTHALGLVTLLATAVAASVPLAAQTTWTSFEDRTSHALGVELSSGMATMFGGVSITTPGVLLDDTITNPTGSGWQPQRPANKPTGRKEHAMAGAIGPNDAPFVILFGGTKTQGTTTVRSNDTWRYDGSSWGEVTPPAGVRPSARTGHGMVQDLLRNRVILIGGSAGILPLNDVWDFDPISNAWMQRPPTSPAMPGRYGHAMAWDPVTGTVLVFGGNGYRSDTWEYDPFLNTWTDRTPIGPNPITGRIGAAMAYLPLTDNLVMFGGASAAGPLDDTWVWNRVSRAWNPASPAMRAPARSGHVMFPAADSSKVIVHGGSNGSTTPLTGLWGWNGVNWAPYTPPPAPRRGVGLAFDSVRQRTVQFGGRSHPPWSDSNETWELEGLTWRRPSMANSPPARAYPAMTYDRTRNKTVLFGGFQGSGSINYSYCYGPLNDTWEWDGTNWQRRTTSSTPPPSGGLQMAYDSRRGVLWMLHGLSMWRYDGSNWFESGMPYPRVNGAGAFDEQRSEFVMHGGGQPQGNYRTMDDTWANTAGTWSRRHSPASPQGRYAHAMAYDAPRGTCVLLGGVEWGGQFMGDTWLWNGSSWSTGQGLPGRYAPWAHFSPQLGMVFVFGGQLQNGTVVADARAWNGSAWQALPGPQPSARLWTVMATDVARGRVVLFGGNDGTQLLSDTWEFDGTVWSQRQPATVPAARANQQMAFDPVAARVMMFGGGLQAGSGQDTWHWDGTNWAQDNPTTVPPARGGGRMWSDGARVRLWGGGNGTAVFGDLWEWTGSNWLDLTSTDPRPSDRRFYAMAYDERRDRVVVFGGMFLQDCSTPTYFGDTWEWDGMVWQQRFPVSSPGSRAHASMVYDLARSRVVLNGGYDSNGPLGDTWEWDGTNWIGQAPTVSPPAVYNHALAYDTSRRMTILSGDVGTWDYGPVLPASTASYGQGCAGTAGVPELVPTPWAGPWLGDRMEIDILRRPPGFGIMVYGFSDSTWNGLPLPLPIAALGIPAGNGCTLQSSVEWSEFLPFSGRYTSFPMPTLPIALGFTMHMQAGFLDAGTPGFPVVVSQGLHIMFGGK